MTQSKDTMPNEIQDVLNTLRTRIRRYVIIEGSAILLIVLCALFWGSLLVDFAYFKLSNLELPQWFRAGFDVIAVSLLMLTFLTWIALRLVRKFRYRALALLLEHRFPELDDRLITAVELSESLTGSEGALGRAMVKRTVDQVTQDTKSLALDDVFEKAPLRRAVVMASVLIVSIAGFAVANQDALNRWKSGYLDLDDVYWDRRFGLDVQVIAQPGDMIKEFAETERGLEYKHPRGGDLTVLITVPDSKELPDQVELSYRLANGRGRGSALCSKVEDGRFRYSVGGLLDDMEFWVSGGDYTNREPYKVKIVDPPRVDEIVLESFYPRYTGLAKRDDNTDEVIRDPVLVQGTQVTLPVETEFLMRVRCNKPLVGVRILYDPIEVAFQTNDEGFGATRTIQTEDGKQQRSVELKPGKAGTFFIDGSSEFVVPFVLSNEASDASKQRIASMMTEYGQPSVIPPDAPIRIFLEDTDDIIGSEPARLTINGVLDEPPRVETGLRGIGTSITRKANIPVTGLVTDDYGIVNARFEFQIDKEGEWQSREFEVAPEGLPRDFHLQRNEEQGFESFAVLPLGLAIGQKLTVQVYAQDGDQLNGPHATRGERFTFTIVSNEELLSILHQRELNLRRRFEQIISELKDKRKDLILHRTRVDERARLQKESADATDTAAKIREIDVALIACAERSLHGIRKNENETSEIEKSFRDIREELVNNLVDTPLMLERIDDRIVNPLRTITSNDYPRVDESLGLFKFANDNGQDPTSSIDESAELLASLIDRMERILLEMRKLESFQEMVELLKAIRESEEKLLEKTKSEQKKELFKRLGLDDE
ncbi:MAG: hypothetical protein CMJ78_14275 [Planctomycetaceae bacterium]|nr:hypothetical protein [Planctomycetaceae bacterium]